MAIDFPGGTFLIILFVSQLLNCGVIAPRMKVVPSSFFICLSGGRRAQANCPKVSRNLGVISSPSGSGIQLRPTPRKYTAKTHTRICITAVFLTNLSFHKTTSLQRFIGVGDVHLNFVFSESSSLGTFQTLRNVSGSCVDHSVDYRVICTCHFRLEMPLGVKEEYV